MGSGRGKRKRLSGYPGFGGISVVGAGISAGFHHPNGSMTIKIEDKVRDRLLAAKLKSIQVVVSYFGPQQGIAQTHIAPQFWGPLPTPEEDARKQANGQGIGV
jgi:hypothetical protein